MNKQKQIKEMARDILNAGIALDGTDCAFGIMNDGDDHFTRLANKLYAVGYRKLADIKCGGKNIRKATAYADSWTGETIFVGDIVDCIDEFGDEPTKRVVVKKDRKLPSASWLIRGNIFENPELLLEVE